MRVMVTGVEGQLGHDVINEVFKRGHKCFGTDLNLFYSKKPDGTMVSKLPYCHMDVSNLATVDRVVDSLRPDVVIHCASYSDSVSAEEPLNYDKVMKVNVKGTENIAIACKKFGAKIIYISSDHVYGGGQKNILDPDESITEPESVFGKSKLMGEEAVIQNTDRFFVVRSQWLYGSSGRNFISDILRNGEYRKAISIAGDSIGTPTYTFDLARLLADMVESEKYGIYNAVNEGGFVSEAQVAMEVFRRAGLRTKVIPVIKDENGINLQQSGVSMLCTEKLTRAGFRKLPPWDSAIGRYLREIKYPTRVRGKLPERYIT
ncbi:MAG: SDR family oxidoreductase [Lachnospiraceae bacterium]